MNRRSIERKTDRAGRRGTAWLLTLTLSAFLPAAPVASAAVSAPVRPAAPGVAPSPQSSGRVPLPGGTFFDDDGRPEEGYIETLAAMGVIRACDPARPDLICPDRPTTPEEVASMIEQVSCLIGRPGPCRDRAATPPVPVPSPGTGGLTLAEAAMAVARIAGLAPMQPPPRPSVSIAMTGDILLHLRVNDRARTRDRDAEGDYDYGPMLARVAGVIGEADLALCHLEVPLSPDNRGLSGYPRFKAPREAATAIADTGYEGCSTASNHSLDKGFGGLSDTLDVLDAAGVAHTGTFTTEEAALTPALYRVGPLVVGHLSYTYGTNGIPLPRNQPWSVNKIETSEIIAGAERARAAGAEFVIVSLHWGAEYRISPTPGQRRIAERLLADDAVDLIVGHHAHVVQPLERIGEKYVAYGLGNFLSGQCCTPPNTRDGVVAHFNVAQRSDGRWAVRSLSFTPTWVDRYGDYHVYPIPESLDDPELPARFKRTLERSLRRTVESLGMLGEAIVVRDPVSDRDAPG